MAVRKVPRRVYNSNGRLQPRRSRTSKTKTKTPFPQWKTIQPSYTRQEMERKEMIPGNCAYLTLAQIETMCLSRQVYFMTQEEAEDLLYCSRMLATKMQAFAKNYNSRLAQSLQDKRLVENTENATIQRRNTPEICYRPFHFPEWISVRNRWWVNVFQICHGLDSRFRIQANDSTSVEGISKLRGARKQKQNV